jgi:hypothetical protein
MDDKDFGVYVWKPPTVRIAGPLDFEEIVNP